jgi:hypothetical protein
LVGHFATKHTKTKTFIAPVPCTMKFTSLALSSALLASVEASSASTDFVYGPEDDDEQVKAHAEQKIWDLMANDESSSRNSNSSNNNKRMVPKKTPRGLRNLQGEGRNDQDKLLPSPVDQTCSIDVSQ